jgi:hypothetical protein
MKPYLFTVLICLVFLFLCFLHLPESFRFGSVQGRDFLVIQQMVQDKKPLFIGPPSEYTIDGRQFFFGPAPYYIILPALLAGNWEPLSVSYFLIFINAVVLFVSLVLFDRFIKDRILIYSFAILYVFTPTVITFSQSYWNPYFMLPTSLLLLALLVRSKHATTKELFLSIGFLFGLGLQFHLSFIFAIFISLVWLSIHNKLTPRTVGIVVSGFVVGFLPLIIFDLRNHFYNLSTFIAVFNNKSGPLAGFTFNQFYLISVFPFLIFVLSHIVTAIHKKLPQVSYVLLGGYILWSLFVIFPAPKQILSYPTLQKMTTLITNDKPEQFNIVDQTTKDDRAMALRYLLTVKGLPPEGVDQYPQAKTLYVYSALPLDSLLKKPVWEIQSFLPFGNVESRNADDTIILYKLTK